MNQLKKLTDRLEQKGLLTEVDLFDKDVMIGRLVNDSRLVGPDALFVAIKGDESDGHLFIDKAVENGAIAIVCETVPGDLKTRFPGTALVTVRNSRLAWAELSAAYFDDPARELALVGITGTNGKSTTAHLVHHVLETLGRPAGLVGTITYQVRAHRQEATHTTPDAFELSRLLHEMHEAGCVACTMEVSSHAIAQHRVAALSFDVAVFTNLTQDHLDYHRTFEEYLQAKKKLFTDLAPEATAVFNADDPSGADMVADSNARKLSYGQSSSADIRFEVLDKGVDGLVLRLDGLKGKYRLVGSFNAYNICAAYSAARALDLQSGDIVGALAVAPPVPGRFEQLKTAGGGLVIVDYAHTPDALRNVLKTARPIVPSGARLICVFGCGGNRDVDKRPKMGRIAEELADVVIATSDNPRTEDPESILHDIRAGLEKPERAFWIADRRGAIKKAAEIAAARDVVVLAGKGHETYQVIGTDKVPFDDHEVARELFDITDTPQTS